MIKTTVFGRPIPRITVVTVVIGISTALVARSFFWMPAFQYINNKIRLELIVGNIRACVINTCPICYTSHPAGRMSQSLGCPFILILFQTAVQIPSPPRTSFPLPNLFKFRLCIYWIVIPNSPAPRTPRVVVHTPVRQIVIIVRIGIANPDNSIWTAHRLLTAIRETVFQRIPPAWIYGETVFCIIRNPARDIYGTLAAQIPHRSIIQLTTRVGIFVTLNIAEFIDVVDNATVAFGSTVRVQLQFTSVSIPFLVIGNRRHTSRNS